MLTLPDCSTSSADRHALPIQSGDNSHRMKVALIHSTLVRQQTGSSKDGKTAAQKHQSGAYLVLRSARLDRWGPASLRRQTPVCQQDKHNQHALEGCPGPFWECNAVNVHCRQRAGCTRAW